MRRVALLLSAAILLAGCGAGAASPSGPPVTQTATFSDGGAPQSPSGVGGGTGVAPGSPVLGGLERQCLQQVERYNARIVVTSSVTVRTGGEPADVRLVVTTDVSSPRPRW